MNHKQATVKFSLNVHSSNTGEVWPMEARDNPKLDERIRESYYADEDEACVGFNIDSIEDLMEILKFYAGRPVRISLGAEVKTLEFSTHAALCEKWQRGTSASFCSMEIEDLSPATAASKMIAIAHALSRWEKKNGLPNVNKVATTTEPKPEDGRNLQEENRHLKDHLATLSKMHAKDLQRLSDMIDFRDNAIRKLRDAKGRHHTMLATRDLFDIVSEECSRDGEN